MLLVNTFELFNNSGNSWTKLAFISVFNLATSLERDSLSLISGLTLAIASDEARCNDWCDFKLNSAIEVASFLSFLVFLRVVEPIKLFMSIGFITTLLKLFSNKKDNSGKWYIPVASIDTKSLSLE